MAVQIHHGDILYAENKNSLKTHENSQIVVVDGMVEGIYTEIPAQFAGAPVTELGRGVIDHTRIFKLLRDSGYSGYLCEELDKSTIGNKESAEINYKYMLENY